MNRSSKIKDTKPVKMWAAISEDVPPQIWEVGFYKDQMQSNLRKIRVTVAPVLPKRKR
jgi:hypothetical protein